MNTTMQFLSVAFTSIHTYSKSKRFTPPSVTLYSATTLHAELKWQKLSFQCIHIKRSPSYSTFTFGVVWTWAVVVCSSTCSPWMLHHSFPFTCCFASEVTGLKPTGFCFEGVFSLWFCFKNYFFFLVKCTQLFLIFTLYGFHLGLLHLSNHLSLLHSYLTCG